jgi:hypothetical protein
MEKEKLNWKSFDFENLFLICLFTYLDFRLPLTANVGQ